ncbi:hypothetical protein HY622_03765 [Candidatus Uhrbacteria bacterium]|nr:hypothetical protein [Candidatus Uhrbacteria bacterium]
MKRLRLPLLLWTLSLFAVAQGTALYVAYQIMVFEWPVGLQVPLRDTGVQAVLQFLALFFAATIAILLLSYLHRGKILFQIVFLAAVFFGLFRLFLVVFPLSLALVVSAIFLAAFLLLPAVWVHDLVVIAAAVGIGSVFGLQFHWLFAALLLLVLSLYDIIAVYVTKHMIPLAHALIERQASFVLFVPDRMRDFRARISQVQPGSGFLIIGGGDVVLPMILTTSLVRVSILASIAAVCGMLIGVVMNHLLIVTRRQPIPALPLMVIGAVVGALAAIGV